MKRVELMLFDPQNDFCVPRGTIPGMLTGAFLVPGAYEAMKRLGSWITDHIGGLDDIHLMLDAHQKLDCCHPLFWRDGHGGHPLGYTAATAAGHAPTVITSTDIKRGVWIPIAPVLNRRMIDYTSRLEKQGKFLTIWDEHCLIRTTGAAVVGEVMEAVNQWCERRGAVVDFITKGTNIFTEHVGAFEAEVPDPDDPSTHLNKPLIETLEGADVLFWASGGPTPCALSSMRQAFEHFSPASITKSVLLTDAMPFPPEPEAHLRQFIHEYTKKGLQLSSTKDAIG